MGNGAAHISGKSKEKLQVWLDPDACPVSLETHPSLCLHHPQGWLRWRFRQGLWGLELLGLLFGAWAPHMALAGASWLLYPLGDQPAPLQRIKVLLVASLVTCPS